jgi:hypothetical protein
MFSLLCLKWRRKNLRFFRRHFKHSRENMIYPAQTLCEKGRSPLTKSLGWTYTLMLVLLCRHLK